jgi:1-phosphatidylinositol-3-phosphate 5-kinase
MVDHKPLPSIPNGVGVTNGNGLSIGARAHRSRLLHHLLSEIHEPGIENKHDALVTVFERALDGIGTCMNKGEWLATFRKTKEVDRRRRRNLKEKEAGTQPGLGTVAPKKVVKTHSGSGSGTPSETSHELAQSIRHSCNESRNNGTSGGSTSSRSNLTSLTLVEKRFLLCVTPFRGRISTPTEVNVFTLIHHERDVECTFVPGKFPVSDTEDVTVLYGDKDWIGKLSSLRYATRHDKLVFQFPSIRHTSWEVHSPSTTLLPTRNTRS